mmetsp:Transcript_28567/g.66190  ORF Transcript_28567/g.66190 Transcript_28567/m.66190 type:complete len:274 (+) Transcript_28567:641-1462(+)
MISSAKDASLSSKTDPSLSSAGIEGSPRPPPPLPLPRPAPGRASRAVVDAGVLPMPDVIQAGTAFCDPLPAGPLTGEGDFSFFATFLGGRSSSSLSMAASPSQASSSSSSSSKLSSPSPVGGFQSTSMVFAPVLPDPSSSSLTLFDRRLPLPPLPFPLAILPLPGAMPTGVMGPLHSLPPLPALAARWGLRPALTLPSGDTCQSTKSKPTDVSSASKFNRCALEKVHRCSFNVSCKITKFSLPTGWFCSHVLNALPVSRFSTSRLIFNEAGLS